MARYLQCARCLDCFDDTSISVGMLASDCIDNTCVELVLKILILPWLKGIAREIAKGFSDIKFLSSAIKM